MILRSEHGNIVHTGDWKIDENPMDGDKFDRNTFEAVSESPTASPRTHMCVKIPIRLSLKDLHSIHGSAALQQHYHGIPPYPTL